MEAGRVGGGEAKQQGAKDWDERGSRWSRSPVWRQDQKAKQKQTAPQREKAGRGWASRWSGVTVRGDPTGCSASRWSAMGRCGFTTQNHFGLDRDRPSHGSRDRKG